MTKKIRAFVKSKDSLDAVKEYFAKNNLPADDVIKGDVAKACEVLQENPATEFLIVEITSKQADKAFEELNKLANVCAPETRVVVVGDVDELRFYKQLIDMGIHEYLLNPVKAEQLERVFQKKPDPAAVNAPAPLKPREDSRVIAIVGSRGGAGASTLAINMAGLFAKREYPTAVLDLDPEFGTVPLMVDVEPSRGFVDALEKPDRVDSLFLDRVMNKVNDSLFVIGAEKNLVETANISADAAEKIIRQLQTKFPYVVVDVAKVTPNEHWVLKNAEVIIVSELSISGLRDTMRLADLVKDTLGNDKLKVVGNKQGLNKKFETSQKDFEDGLGFKLDHIIPFEAEFYGYNDSGKIPSLDEKLKSKAIESITQLAAKFMPDAVGVKKEEKKKGLLDGLMGKKKV